MVFHRRRFQMLVLFNKVKSNTGNGTNGGREFIQIFCIVMCVQMCMCVHACAINYYTTSEKETEKKN